MVHVGAPCSRESVSAPSASRQSDYILRWIDDGRVVRHSLANQRVRVSVGAVRRSRKGLLATFQLQLVQGETA